MIAITTYTFPKIHVIFRDTRYRIVIWDMSKEHMQGEHSGFVLENAVEARMGTKRVLGSVIWESY